DDVRLLTYTQPRLVSGIPKKACDLMEVRVGGGTIEERLGYAKSILGKEIKITDFAKEGTMIDVSAITKGKGFQGAVKRWGIKLLSHKNSKHRRLLGTLGPKRPGYVRPTVPQAGQMGYHQRTEFNKRILKIGDNGGDVTPKGGFLHYGTVGNAYVLIHGSVPGPTKRLIRLRDPVRRAGVELKDSPALTYVSTESKQGA
ncbi:MAG: 50S ribosomal protein L3, partial [Euryarchaeota archaeon]|nr:50S ribosomal protein L3 [Euryarchaeota archaeon]